MSEALEQKNMIIERIKKGELFGYPTDTIYGLGCDARNEVSVQKIREMKNRFENPFSVVVPDLKWIYEHCETSKKIEFWISRFPGKYTFILKLKNTEELKTVSKDGKIAVRIPENKIMDIFSTLDFPIITTSLNTLDGFVHELKDISEFQKNNLDFFIDQGLLIGEPSQIIDLTYDDPKIIR